MLGDTRLELDNSNILSIEYLNNYEMNLRAILKVSIRVDIRRKLWILKNKRKIVAKFELNKFGMDPEVESIVTGTETVWNQEFSIYLNDADESIDTHTIESRLEMEGSNIDDIEMEDYFDSQNLFDIYLFNQSLMNASNKTVNKVFTRDTLQQCIGYILTETKHPKVLMSKFENSEVYQELLVPANKAYKAISYLDQYYGFYKTGAMIYYDIDVLYILNSNGKVTAKRSGEWSETTILVQETNMAIPWNGMLRNEDEKIFYISVPDSNVGIHGFTSSFNESVGSEAKIITSDDITINTVDANQTYTNQRNQTIEYTRKDDNKFLPYIYSARMEENECTLYIYAFNLDINAFTPNKEFRFVFDDPEKQKQFGHRRYRLAYASHRIYMESEHLMSSSHALILKSCGS